MKAQCDHEYYRRYGYPEVCPYDRMGRRCINYDPDFKGRYAESGRAMRHVEEYEAEERGIPYRADIGAERMMPEHHGYHPGHRTPVYHPEQEDYTKAVREYVKEYLCDSDCSHPVMDYEAEEKECAPRETVPKECAPKEPKPECWMDCKYYEMYISYKRMYEECARKLARRRRPKR